MSIPYILRIQRPSFIHVAGAFDDGAAVGENGEFAAVGLELEQETVVADFATRFQMPGHAFEIEPAGNAMRDLHGVSSAQTGGAGSLFAVKPFEAAALTARTVGLPQERRDLDATLDIIPDIH